MSIATGQLALNARLLTTRDQLREIAPAWEGLWRRCPEATSFQRAQWLMPWVEAFAPREVCAITVRIQKTLVGFAPLLIYGRGNERVLAFMGGGVSDYLDVLVDPEYSGEVMEKICLAAGEISDWDTLELTDLSPDSVLLGNGFLEPYAHEHDVCSVLHLPESREQLIHIFSKRQRANLRNAQSRLQKAGGARIEVATSETLNEALEDLIRLHTSRWSQSAQPGVLSAEAVKAFHSSSAPALLECGILRLYRLRLAGRTLAVIYALFERETVYCYLQGFDPESAYFGPGTVLMFKMMEDAIHQGFRKFDFLRGREVYKQHWRASERPTYRVVIPRSQIKRVVPFVEAA
jgi:CelD/BcsL family acetyltransferase involved in cellulose biosynthesis